MTTVPPNIILIRSDQQRKLNSYRDAGKVQLFNLAEKHDELNNLYGRPETVQVSQRLMQKYMTMAMQRDRKYPMSRGGLSPILSFAYLHKK